MALCPTDGAQYFRSNTTESQKLQKAGMNLKLLSSTNYAVLYDLYTYKLQCLGQNKIKQQLKVKLLVDSQIQFLTFNQTIIRLSVQIICKLIYSQAGSKFTAVVISWGSCF